MFAKQTNYLVMNEQINFMPQSPGCSLTNVPNVTQTAIIFGIYNWYLYDIFLRQYT